MLIRLYIIAVFFLFSGCAETQKFFNSLGDFEVESPSGKVTKCVVDKEECVQVCETVVEGHNVKKKFDLDEEQCQKEE